MEISGLKEPSLGAEEQILKTVNSEHLQLTVCLSAPRDCPFKSRTALNDKVSELRGLYKKYIYIK